MEKHFFLTARRDPDSTSTWLHPRVLPDVLEDLGWSPVSEDFVAKAKVGLLDPKHKMLSYDNFVAAVQRYREQETFVFRQRAGFSIHEVEIYREFFNKYDRKGTGQLSLAGGDIMPLLEELGKSPQTVIQREQLSQVLLEVDEDQSGEIDFWEFLQLMRRFLDESDAKQLMKEKDAVARTQFTVDEVSQWRDIFIKFDEDHSGEFDVGEGKKLLSAVGVNLNVRVMHDKYLAIFKEVDEDNNGLMDFPEFLLMMRKILDIDFGGIATRLKPPEPGSRKPSKGSN